MGLVTVPELDPLAEPMTTFSMVFSLLLQGLRRASDFSAYIRDGSIVHGSDIAWADNGHSFSPVEEDINTEAITELLTAFLTKAAEIGVLHDLVVSDAIEWVAKQLSVDIEL